MEHNTTEKQKEPFLTPDNYFDTLETRLISRIQAQKQPAKTHWLRPTIAAASLAAIILCTILIINTQNSIQQKTNQIISAETDRNDPYYDEINDELTSAEIEEALAQLTTEN